MLKLDGLSREEVIRRDSYRFLVSLAVIAWMNIIFWFYIVSFPMVNVQWENTSPDETPVSYRGGILWFIVFFTMINGLLPLALLFLLAQPNSLIRSDIHFIITFLSLVLSVIAVIGIVLVFLLWCNTSISGAAVACNSGPWCCVFNTAPSNGNECPSTTPCNPAQTRDTLGTSNGEWRQFFWLGIVQTIIALFHLVVNRLIHGTGLTSSYTKREAKIFAIIFLLGSCGFFFWFVGILSVNFTFLCGYPLLEGGSDVGERICTLYSWGYWFVWLLYLNVLPILGFGAAMIVNRNSIMVNAHKFLSIVAAIFTLASFIYFIGVLVFQTNDYLFPSPLSLSNNERYCCDKFASQPNICPNTTPCLPGTSVPMLANPNHVFVLIFVASLGFLVNSTLHIVLNVRMKTYQIFYSPLNLKDD
jgi:MFS family permease